MDKRTKIPVRLALIDYLLEITGAIGLVCLIFLPICFYNELPNEIPKHFNAFGQVDSYGKREFVWLLPAVGLVLYAGLTVLNKFPFAFNYLAKVTKENAERLYILGIRTIRILKIVIILLFAFLNFKIIEIALNKPTEIGKLFLPILVTAIAILIGIMIYKITKSRM